jgi:signal transduction histidine kinase
MDEALALAQAASSELRELSHGVLPGALSRGGLATGIEALVSRVRLPVTVEVTAERLPAALEATAYFIVAESLTNVVRHARASRAQITVGREGGGAGLEVRTTASRGGAQTTGAQGCSGSRPRSRVDGELRIDSPPGGDGGALPHPCRKR